MKTKSLTTIFVFILTLLVSSCTTEEITPKGGGDASESCGGLPCK